MQWVCTGCEHPAISWSWGLSCCQLWYCPPCSAAQACWVCHGSLYFSFILHRCLGKGHHTCPAPAALGCTTPPRPAHILSCPSPCILLRGWVWRESSILVPCTSCNGMQGNCPSPGTALQCKSISPLCLPGAEEPLAAMPGVGDSAVPGSAPAQGLSIQQNEACSCRGVNVCTHSPGPGPTGQTTLPASLAPHDPQRHCTQVFAHLPCSQQTLQAVRTSLAPHPLPQSILTPCQH